MKSKGINFRKVISNLSNRDELALDIGSANTKIFLNNKEIFFEPTCIAYHKGSDSVVSVGQKALMLLGKAPSSIEVVFPVQHGSLSNTKYFELYLTTVLNLISTESKFGKMIFGFRGKVAVMSSLSPSKRRLLLSILKKIGFSKIELVDASYAAAVSASGGNKTHSGNICIIDIGAQKTEIAVFSLGELIASKHYKWGGIQLTESLQKISRSEHKCVVGWHLAEEAKKQIGTLENTRSKYVIRGKDLVTQSSKTITINSEDVRAEFNKLFDNLLDNLQNFISTLPSETAISILDRGIFVTGGTSLLKGIDKAIIERLKCDVFLSNNPQLDVINGLKT